MGTALHLYNVTKRAGGTRLENFSYGAPAAIALAGMAGLALGGLAALKLIEGSKT